MSNDLIDHLLEQAQTLTKQERQILASRLVEENSHLDNGIHVHELPDEIKYRKREYQWMKEHRDEYPGEHLALEGDKLIAHGKTLRQVMDEAGKVGAKAPLFVYIESPDELPFGGW